MGCHPERLRQVRAKPRARSCTWVRAIPSLKGSCEVKGEITATCSCYRESQTYLGLHPQKCGQQIEGGGLAPSLCTDETTSEYSNTDVEPSVQEKNGYPEGYKNDPRDEILSL